MSYSFVMTFKEIGKSDLPAYILDLMRFNREHIKEVLEENAGCIPSIRLCVGTPCMDIHE